MEARYCYFDGVLLQRDSGSPPDGASINFGARAFTNPLVFATDRVCRNFDELARACHADPQAALDLLRQGYLENFLSSQGRIDLARVAREAARAPDRQRGLDDFLGKLPSAVLGAPRLRVEPATIDLGTMRVGEDRRVELTIINEGMRLLHGGVATDAPWLRLGDSPRVRQKLIEVTRRSLLPVHVLGLSLRAYHKPQTGEIVFETNGGKAVVRVMVRVPVTPFPEGAMAGAATPRELAARAKVAPKDAAALIESGAVARWYRVNGWTYPVQGPTAQGIGAVQQFFEALGLVRPPEVQINPREVYLQGRPGEMLKQSIDVFTLENRAVVAHAVSDQPWLQIRRTVPNGRTARVRLSVPVVPYEPGETLRCRVTITANGNQQFVVPLTLAISSTEAEAPLFVEEVAEAPLPVETPREVEPTMEAPADFVPWQEAAPPARIPEAGPVAWAAPQQESVPLPPPVYPRQRRRWGRWVPLLLLGLGFLLTTLRDQLLGENVRGPLFIQLSGPLTPGSELKVTAGVRHAFSGESIRLELGDGLAFEGSPATQLLPDPAPGVERQATWQVRIAPDARWAKLKVTHALPRPTTITRVVPIRSW
jgi:hypothetical protein